MNHVFLLRQLGVDSSVPYIGDIEDAVPINLDTASHLKVHSEFAPFLGFGDGEERCSGCKLIRFNRKTIGIPCFVQELLPEQSFCAHCAELWASPDDDGFYKLSKKKMAAAVAFYKAGKRNVLWRLPSMKEAEQVYSEQILQIRQTLDGSPFELATSWPDMHFREVLEFLLVKPGIVSKNLNRSTNPTRRLEQEQLDLTNCVKAMLSFWL